jgi:RNA polymerase sigma-70 factor (ECF subfamily)
VLDVHDLYASHLDRVYAFFAYRLRSTVDAEDLTSATFERVVRHRTRFDPARASVTTWIFAIAENVLVDHYRRQGRRDEGALDDEAQHWRAPEDRPSIALSQALQDAVEALSERERQVVGLRFGAELTGREIGEVVGASEANVHQILSRSLRKMRAVIGSPDAAR